MEMTEKKNDLKSMMVESMEKVKEMVDAKPRKRKTARKRLPMHRQNMMTVLKKPMKNSKRQRIKMKNAEEE